jgi:hypothetical protein
MGILNQSLGIGIKENPLVFSPFTSGYQEGTGFPPGNADEITTEDGTHITTESAIDITTE